MCISTTETRNTMHTLQGALPTLQGALLERTRVRVDTRSCLRKHTSQYPRYDNSAFRDSVPAMDISRTISRNDATAPLPDRKQEHPLPACSVKNYRHPFHTKQRLQNRTIGPLLATPPSFTETRNSKQRHTQFHLTSPGGLNVEEPSVPCNTNPSCKEKTVQHVVSTGTSSEIDSWKRSTPGSARPVLRDMHLMMLIYAVGRGI